MAKSFCREALAFTVALFLCHAATWAGEGFITAPESPELRALAQTLHVNEDDYGAGPLTEPGQTYYVAQDGDDEADGLSWETAWRTLRHAVRVHGLEPGDTLLVGEGTYSRRGVTLDMAGEPGRPVRIMAAPGERVTIDMAQQVGPFEKTPGRQFVHQAPLSRRNWPEVWESDSLVRLQEVDSVDRVEELPGTYWWDEGGETIYVHFSDGRDGEGRYVANRAYWFLRVSGSRILLRGLHFKHGHSALNLNRSEHVTVEECVFHSHSAHGMSIGSDARRALIRDNYGFNNGHRGSILYGRAQDCLFIRNRFDSSQPTERVGAGHLAYAINQYGFEDGRGIIILDNVMNDPRTSFRWKPTARATVFQGNVTLGRLYAQSFEHLEGDERLVLRNNALLGTISWRADLPHEGADGDWAGPHYAFVNNYHGGGGEEAVEAARFADPAWLDLRLQADSPLRGAGLGGLDRGAFPRGGEGRALYVGPDGDDGASGLSAREPFATLAHAAGQLRPGDALYLLEGRYGEPLRVGASGTEEQPIRVRAHGKRRVVLPAVEVAGSHVRLEGLEVDAAEGDGITVSGEGVGLKKCVVRGAPGAGVRASAPGFSMERCTVAENGVGLALEEGATAATVGSSLFAGNRGAAVRLAEGARASYRGRNNGYHGPGLDEGRIREERGSVVAEPLFRENGEHRYDLRWDCPMRYAGGFGRPAGARPAQVRPLPSPEPRVTGKDADSALVRWETPGFDTTGHVRYRRKGAGEWQTVTNPVQGSVHGVGLTGLEPGAEYEFRVEAACRRGPEAFSETMSFATLAEPREPATYYVAPGGDDRADGLTPGTAWRTIRHACLTAGPGDTVLVAPGEYAHAIVPARGGAEGRRITFRGVEEDGRWPVIAAGVVLDPLVEIAERDWVTVDGFDFDIGPPRALGTQATIIRVERSEGVEILNCRRVGPASSVASATLFARGASRLRVEGNLFYRSRYHLRLFSCNDVVVRNNTLALKSVVNTNISGRRVVFENNLLYENRSFRNAFFSEMDERTVREGRFDHNLYFTTDGRLGLVGNVAGNLAEWREASGQEAHSVEADPLFVGVGEGMDMDEVDESSFLLRPGSPALGAGADGADIGATGVAGERGAAAK